MGEFNKDQGQTNQGGEFGNKSAFGQFDNDQNQQDRINRTEQDSGEFAGAEDDRSAARGEAMGGQAGQQQTGQDRTGEQGEFGGKGGQQQAEDQSRAQQGDDQYRNEKDLGGDQNR